MLKKLGMPIDWVGQYIKTLYLYYNIFMFHQKIIYFRRQLETPLKEVFAYEIS